MSRRAILLCSIGGVTVIGVIIAVSTLRNGGRAQASTEDSAMQWAEVKEVVNGHKVELRSDEKLIYAAIRAPYPHEPMYEQSKRRNAELVQGKRVRLRFDAIQRDDDDRLCAYVTVENTFINETLVLEGLAYVRLTPQTQRYARRLLAAQAEARAERRGLWRSQPQAGAGGYPADPKYGTFHRPACEVAAQIKPERRIVYDKRDDALDHGMAPCPKCRP